MNDLLDRYFDSLRNRRVAVLGIGVSNRPLIRMLLAHGIRPLACDKTPREQLDEEVLAFERQGAVLSVGEGYLEDIQADVIFRSPGMRPDIPILCKLIEQGAVLTSEMEAFFALCPCKILAVTGSDGKTTTTTLIAQMLREAGKTVWLGGNIGTPLLPMVEQMKPEDFAVVELSSFQLLTMQRSADVAVVTNLAPNHLDIHRDMAEYVAAKKNVFLHQSRDGILVLNHDNAITDSFSALANGSVLKFSRAEKPDLGCYFDGKSIFFGNRRIVDAENILLPGLHNIENYMAAICAVQGIVPDEAIRKVAGSFTGVEHRIELVRTLHGVRYYNDSIASSPSRTIAGLHAFSQKVILIAGGYDKKIPFDVLGPEICSHVRVLVLCGATAGKIRAAVEQAAGDQTGRPEIVEVSSLAEAVDACRMRASEGDVVTLSPACAAFDQFKNFMVRGEAYKKLVMELK